ncbi:hypothetical protein EYB25_000552 [Talaromyces marneffei]|nr:hypothetical protein EYB25_000552 [Talaromyces marneffei]
MLLYLAAFPFVLFASIRTYNLIKNYNDARKYGLPIILLPVSFEDAWWMIFRPLFAWVERLPLRLGNWYVYTEMGWPTVDGDRTTKRLGENFVLCSPVSNHIITCYPAGAETIYKNNSTWHFPPAQSQLFAFYGQNVSSTTGADWQRHRKITTAAFNDHFMREVWNESTKKAALLNLAEEKDRKLDRVRSTFDVLAMNVLAVVGFGQERLLNTATAGHKQSLMQCLGFILQHILLTAIFNSLKAPDFLLPGVLQRLKQSVAEFKLYMEELVLHQMLQSSSVSKNKSSPPTLLEAMVNANEAEKHQLQKMVGRPSYLTESELYGNLFVFNLAGYETTASTMTFALSFLAANAEVQSWIEEELDRYYTPENDQKQEYATTYPKLVRCLALMYETLRLASPAPLLVRAPSLPQELPIILPNGQERIVTVNPGTLVGGHFYGGHLSTRWGPDAHVFNPKRFISKSAVNGEEELVVPPDTLFIPWLTGPRVCPGKKFSQVEFVAIVAQIFSEYRVEILKEGNESEAVARHRFEGVVGEKYFNVSTHLKKPTEGAVRFVRR